MGTMRIYLAGGMGNLSYEEQTTWRNRFRDAVKYGVDDLPNKVDFFSPPEFYNFNLKEHKTEKEVMEFDLYNIRRSDIIVVNFNDPNSIGTAMELMFAKEHNIPVIGLNSDGVQLHPWLVECCTRICDNFKELVEHVVNFYLK